MPNQNANGMEKLVAIYQGREFQDKQRKSEFQEPASCPIGICPFFPLKEKTKEDVTPCS
jgi:hypothetical protein